MQNQSDNPVIEFNRDMFYVNQIDYSNINCENYQLNTDCSSNINNTIDKKYNCEVCKNKSYKEWYNSNPVSQGNYLDINEQYQRSWVQTINLSLGIIGLGIGTYYFMPFKN